MKQNCRPVHYLFKNLRRGVGVKKTVKKLTYERRRLAKNIFRRDYMCLEAGGLHFETILQNTVS